MRTILHRNPARFAAAAATLIIAAFSVASWSLYQSHRNACDARNVTLNVMGDILVAAQHQTDTNPLITAKAKANSDRFVVSAIRTIDKARC